jgi:hypothetical protein
MGEARGSGSQTGRRWTVLAVSIVGAIISEQEEPTEIAFFQYPILTA